MADLAAAMSALQEDRQAIDEAVDLVSMAIAKGMDGGEGSSGEDGEAGSGSKGSFAP